MGPGSRKINNIKIFIFKIKIINTTDIMAQSCLEIRSMQERHEEIVRNRYNVYDQYSATHPDALANGDKLGKGTGHGGHTHSLPNCNGSIGIIDYRNFDTAIASHAGNADDNYAREVALARSLYNIDNEYSARSVDTSMNLREGQYRVP